MTAKLIESNYSFKKLEPLESYEIDLSCPANNEDAVHNVILNNSEYQMQIKKIFFIDQDRILIRGWLTNDEEFGTVSFELTNF